MTRVSLLACGALVLLAGETVLALQELAPAPATLMVRPRRIYGLLGLLPAGLLYALFLFRPRPYVRAWVAMWLSLVSALLLASVGPEALNLGEPEGRTFRLNVARVVVTVGALAWLGGTAVLAVTAGWIRREPRWPRGTLGTALAISAGFLAGAFTVGLRPVLQTTALLGSLLLATATVRFVLHARREQSFGALLVGIPIGLIPLNNLLANVPATSAWQFSELSGLWVMAYGLVGLGMFLIVFEDLTTDLRKATRSLEAAHAELRDRAITDPLTACHNRRFFEEIAGHELARHRRFGLPISLLFVDVDRFKDVNDRHGHEAGDRVLAAVGGLLKRAVRRTDYVFRWGGDEFLLILTCDEARARAKADEIQGAFTADPVRAGLPEGVGLSIGAVGVPPASEDLGVWVREADARMYANKTRA